MATETRKPTAAIAPFGLRMQPELRERIEAAAETAGRSMNAEIIARLEMSFVLANEPTIEKATQVADKIVQRVMERVERIGAEYQGRIKELEAENRALREGGTR